MALAKQLIPISFYQGQDNKSDDKQSVPGSLLVLENGIFTNPGKISKRNGFDQLSRSSTEGNISQGKALTGFNDELLAFTGSDVLAFSESEQLWQNRGKDYILSDKTSMVFSNNSQQQNPESKVFDNLELYVWEDVLAKSLQYSIIDHLNGSVLVSNQTMDPFGSRPKVIVFNSIFVIIYFNSGQLFARTIDPNNAFAITDAVPLITDIHPQFPNFDVLSPVQADGYFYLAYNNTVPNTLTCSFRAVSSTGLFSRITSTINSSAAIGIWEDDINNLWVSAVSATDFFASTFYTTSIACIITKGASTTIINSGFTIYEGGEQEIYRICGYKNIVSGENIIYYELIPFDDFVEFNVELFGHYIKKAIVLTDGTIQYDLVFKRGLGLYSKPFFYNGEYLTLFTTNSEFQATYYLINDKGVTVSRSNVNNGGGYKANSLDGALMGMCTDSVVIDSANFLIPLQIKTTFISNNNTIILPTAINSVRYDFSVDNTLMENVLGNCLNICGGVFKTYDGVNLTENNFFQYPENVTMPNGGSAYIEVIQSGTFTLPQIAYFFLPFGAWGIPTDAYITISASTTANYYCWFRKDSNGKDPAPVGFTRIIVDIDSTDGGNTVLEKLGDALVRTGQFTYFNDAISITITNVSVGSFDIPSPTTGTLNAGNITPGTRLYKVIYEWIDNLGQIQRSGSSVAISSVTTSTGNTVLVVPTLRITEKKNINVVIYRTEDLGTDIFYRVTDIFNPIKNNPLVDWVSFIDTNSDASILANDTIYTTGNVLDNSAPPSSSMSALYKNRIFIGGLEDGNLLWFSKTNNGQQAPEFSEFLTLKVTPKFGFVTALGVIDDKLIIFKEDGIFVLVGNGPTNTGDSDDFENGFTEVSTDIGCIEPKSVVLFPGGLIFKSRKGLYVLDRSLQTQYIGSNVENFNQYNITSAVLNPLNNQVRFTTNSSNILVYDYYVNQWAVFTNLPANDSCYIGENYYLIKPDGTVYKENVNSFNDAGAFIKLKIQTSWMSFAKLQGFQRLWRLGVLGSYIGPHLLNISISYNFNISPSQFTTIDAGTLIGQNSLWGSDATWGLSTPWGGGFIPYEWRVHLTQQKCTSILITIEDSQSSSFNEGFDISSIVFEAGVKQGSNKLGTANSFGNRT